MTNTPEADEPQTFAAVATERAPAYTQAPAIPAAAPSARQAETPGLSPDALAAEGKKWTEQLLQAMGFECTVDSKAEADHVDVTVRVTANDELLTGPKGEVRQAMQHLLNRMINRGEGSRYHLQLEINDFWAQREAELGTLARSMAEQALAGNEEIVSEYLNAQERRVIHVALREDTRVKTYALGNGMIKRIAVAPAGAPDGPRDDD